VVACRVSELPGGEVEVGDGLGEGAGGHTVRLETLAHGAQSMLRIADFSKLG